MYTLGFSEDARQFFERAEAPLQRKLDRCFEMLRDNPHHHPNIKRLQGDWIGAFRYRVGDYRVIYRVDVSAQLVKVLVIAHRSGVYE